jgi:hypothetical protein
LSRYQPKHYNAKHSARARQRERYRRLAELAQPVPGLRRRRFLLAGAALAAVGLAVTGLEVFPGRALHASSAQAPPAKVAEVQAAGSSPEKVASLASQLGVVPSESAGWVAAENTKTGTSAWRLTKPATAGEIEGYAGAVSVGAGQPVDLYVSTAAPSFQVEAFRMGYYGGAFGHLVWSAGPVQGIKQPACPVTATTNTVSCSWSDPVSVPTTGWVPGDYLFKLTSSSGWESHVPLTVRDDSSHAAYLVNNSVTTWQAYNLYGGYDLYSGPTGKGGVGLAARSKVVSFDRPYALGYGGGDFVALELPMVSMMESLGLDVSYTTDVDVSERPSTLLQHRAFISLGHDEYWTLNMRTGVTAARDAGVNLVFLGANAAYRHIRLQSSSLGPDREEVDYKDPHVDPLLGKDNADVTPWAWRDWPNNDPESLLLGEMWQCNPVQADMVVTDPDAWLFAGTGLQNGSHIPGVVGPEYDHFDPYAPNPGNVMVAARSPVRCGGQREEADMTYYSASSGAGVWDTGTIDWVGSVLPYCATCTNQGPVTRITVNVLAAFGSGPAGDAHPSKANVLGTGKAPTTSTTLTLPGGGD